MNEEKLMQMVEDLKEKAKTKAPNIKNIDRREYQGEIALIFIAYYSGREVGKKTDIARMCVLVPMELAHEEGLFKALMQASDGFDRGLSHNRFKGFTRFATDSEIEEYKALIAIGNEPIKE